MVMYERSVAAKLVVQLDNGESWDATTEDLERFGLIRASKASAALSDYLQSVITTGSVYSGRSVVDTPLNPFRYAAEIILNGYPDHMSELAAVADTLRTYLHVLHEKGVMADLPF